MPVSRAATLTEACSQARLGVGKAMVTIAISVAVPRVRSSFFIYYLRDAARLKLIDSRQWQHPLKNRAKADQYHEQFQKICQTTVISEFFDGPKTNCADDANNKNAESPVLDHNEPRPELNSLFGHRRSVVFKTMMQDG